MGEEVTYTAGYWRVKLALRLVMLAGLIIIWWGFGSLITDIIIWGSWLNDDVPWDDSLPNNQHNVVFKLSIHDDLTGADPSRPGELRRQYFFQPADLHRHRQAGVAV